MTQPPPFGHSQLRAVRFYCIRCKTDLERDEDDSYVPDKGPLVYEEALKVWVIDTSRFSCQCDFTEISADLALFVKDNWSIYPLMD